MAVLGKTGTGKSSLFKHMAVQDIVVGRGLLYFDHHGDTVPFLLGVMNALERERHEHLSDKLILIDPTDRELSVGFNPLERPAGSESPEFVRIVEFAQILRRYWGLDSFGARTDELLRNSLYVLSANGLTLVELAPLLTHTGFRDACLKQVANADVRQYFEFRYNQASEPMRATMREPVLNKVSAFTADPHFRHIVGQPSTFSLKDAMDSGHVVIVNLAKGRLGEQALTLGSLILAVAKNALFSREKRSLFTVYCDEIQNLVATGASVETMFSESRKFGVGVVGSTQYLDQLPADVRGALLSIGTHIFFQLSSTDAVAMSQALGGSRSLTERLKNLPQRHCLVKSGSDQEAEIVVPTVRDPKVDYTDLLNRARYSRGRVRAHIERDIAKRQAALQHNPSEAIHDWK